MDKTNAERQRRWRDRRRQNDKALLDKLAALEDRVAQLESALASRSPDAPRKAPGHGQDAALKRERDELAERLQQIEAYEPGVSEKARAGVKQIDRTPRRGGLLPSG